jgi:ubiquinone biosynthesis protein
MQWIQTGRQLGQAVKNVQRLRQIIAVFARHGYADLVVRMNLGKYLPSRLTRAAESAGEKTPPVRLREAFEELGPTFVKFGQVLSTRSDVIPEAFLEEFTRLQDNVQPLPFATVRAQVQLELGRKLEDAFAAFREEPIAAASIGQVHEAELKTGEKVVVKVQRPEIQRLIDMDVSLLAFLAGLLEKYVPESRVVNPRVIVDEFFRTLQYELDFVVEANNMARMAENLREFPEVVIPKVYKAHSTQRVLTLEKLEGIRVNDLKAMDAAGIDRKRVVETGARAFFKTVMMDGLFHGDLHGGNLFILPGNRLGIIDFGIVGRLSQKSRDQLAQMVMALVTEDYETLCYHYAELGSSGSTIDFDAFQREVRYTLSPYVGLSLAEINMGRVLIEATKIATRHDIKIPGDWMIVFKAILTMEGMGRTLDPHFDLLALGQDLVKDLVKEQYSVPRISKDFLFVARDVAALLQVVPRQIRWMFRKLNANDFALEFRSQDLQDLRAQLDANARRLSLSVVTTGLFVAGAIALQHQTEGRVGDYPLTAFLLLVAGAALLLRLLLRGFR